MLRLTFLLLVMTSAASAQVRDSLPHMTAAQIAKADKEALKRKEGEIVPFVKEPLPLSPIERQINYPTQAKDRGLSGRVILDCLVSASGNIVKVRLLKSSDSIFDEAARQALLNTKFSPAIDSTGKPVPLWLTRSITFKAR